MVASAMDLALVMLVVTAQMTSAFRVQRNSDHIAREGEAVSRSKFTPVAVKRRKQTGLAVAELTDKEIEKNLVDLGPMGDDTEMMFELDTEDAGAYAMKSFHPQQFAGAAEQAEQEAKMMQMVQSDNVVGFNKKFHKENGDIAILTELMTGGDLSMSVKCDEYKCELNNGMEVKDAFRQIVAGLKHVHAQGVAHLDLQPENIFVQGQQVKIGEFASAIELQGEACLVETTSLNYMPPEILRSLVNIKNGGECTPVDLKTVDIWQLGVTFYQILTGSMPWRVVTGGKSWDTDIPSFLIKMDDFEGMKGVYMPSDKQVDKQAIDLVQHMLQIDPAKRYTIEQVASHKFFSQDKEEELATFAAVW
jgi:serine/threonine protein kinase